MRLADFFSPEAIALDLGVTTRDAALEALVDLLRLEPAPREAVLQGLRRREQLGSTGVGGGIAIPHCRSVAVPAVRMAYGRVPGGLAYEAIDGNPVHHLFLIVAPPVEVSNDYLPALGALARVARQAEFAPALAKASSPADVLRILAAG